MTDFEKAVVQMVLSIVDMEDEEAVEVLVRFVHAHASSVIADDMWAALLRLKDGTL